MKKFWDKYEMHIVIAMAILIVVPMLLAFILKDFGIGSENLHIGLMMITTVVFLIGCFGIALNS
jgi:hypothetical protein